MAFKPGQSGNAGGRPKVDPALKEMFRAAAPKAAKALLDLMDNSDDEKIRMEAAKVVLDRALGKPMQSVDTTSGGLPLSAIIHIGPKPSE